MKKENEKELLDKETKITVAIVLLVGLILMLALVIYHIGDTDATQCPECGCENISYKEDEPNMKCCKDCGTIWNEKNNWRKMQ